MIFLSGNIANKVLPCIFRITCHRIYTINQAFQQHEIVGELHTVESQSAHLMGFRRLLALDFCSCDTVPNSINHECFFNTWRTRRRNCLDNRK